MKKITVNKSDEVVVIVEKIIDTDDNEVVLSVPRFSHIGESLSNFHLLKREADALDKKITIESVDDQVIELAELSGITAVNPFFTKNRRQFSDIVMPDKKQKGKRQKISAGVFPEDEPKKSAKDEEIERKIEEFNFPEMEIKKPRRSLASFIPKISLPSISIGRSFWMWVLVFGVVAMSIYLGIKVLPRAKVIIIPQTKEWAYKDSIVTDKSLSMDVSKMTISNQIFSQKKNVYLKFPASGKRQVEKSAGGTITVFNSYSSDPQPLVERTRFMTPDGKLFRLVKSITVPGAKISEGKIIPSSIDAEIVADKAGPDYNIGPVKLFTIPGLKGTAKYQAFYGESKGDMTGGFVGEVSYPTAEDIKKAKESALSSLEETLNTELFAQIPKDFKILDGAKKLKVISQKADEEADENSQFGVFSDIQLSIIVFKEDDLKNLLDKRAIQEGGSDFDIRTSEFTYGLARADFEKGVLSFPVDYKSVLVRHVDVEVLKNNIMGKSETELKTAIFSLPGLKSATVSLWPFWVKTVPNEIKKIEIVIE